MPLKSIQLLPQVSTVCSFMLLSSIPWCGRTSVCFTHWRTFGMFSPLAITDKNMWVCWTLDDIGWILLGFSGFGCSLRTVSHIFLRLRLKRQWLPRLSCPHSYSRGAREQDHWFRFLSVIGCMVPADIPLTKVSHRVKWGGGKVYVAHRRSGRESNLHNNLLW